MYRFRLSVAYYELLSLDVARVDYDSGEEKPKKADLESVRLNEESLRKARERHKQNEWKAGKLSDLNTNE